MTKDEILGRLEEAKDLVVWAIVCLYQTITGQETTCPDCWKCTAIRWGVFLALMAIAYAIFGELFILAVVICVGLLIWKGKGPWVRVREWIKKRLGK